MLVMILQSVHKRTTLTSTSTKHSSTSDKHAMLRPRELVRLSQLFEKDANQGQLISAVRVENLQPGTKKKKVA